MKVIVSLCSTRCQMRGVEDSFFFLNPMAPYTTILNNHGGP